MAIRQPLSTGTSESSIIFYNGGHNHDGISSARIDTAKYSFYDFTANFSSIEAIRLVQEENSRVFKNVIAEIVKTSVLGPSGITLGPQQVRAENISAGAVTATALAANIVLVNNVIRSNNFDGTVLANGTITTSGTVGWAVSGQGQAVFDTTFIRGSLSASEVLTPGVDIYSNGTLAGGSFTLYGNGAIVTSSGNFQVDASGNLSAENAEIRGEISSDTFVTHTNFAGAGAWTRPTVLIDNGNNRMELNTAGGGVRMNGDQWLAYRSGDSFYKLNFNFSSNDYSVGGNFTADGEIQGSDFISYGKGVYYNASNLESDGFPIAFGYSNGTGQLNALVDNNTGVSFYLTKTAASDRRLKDNIEPISSAVLDKFYSIKTYEFDWNDKAPQYMQNAGRSVGVIADELKGLYPTAVLDSGSYEGWVHRYDEHPEGFSLEEMEKFDSDYYEFVPGEGVWQKPRYASVDYTVLIPHLISVIHDLNNRIKELESKV